MEFPLLRLSFVPLQEVFKAMHPFEIINFSMISKRTKGLTKQMSFLSRYSIQLGIDKELDIVIDGNWKKKKTGFFYIITSDETANGKMEENDWLQEKSYERFSFKYSENGQIEEWKLWMGRVAEIFNMESMKTLTMYTDMYDMESIVDCLKTHVKSIEMCSMSEKEAGKTNGEQVAEIMNNILIKKELNLFLSPLNNDFDARIPKNLKMISIKDAKWVGYEKLLDIDCRKLVLDESLLTNEDWNSFIKKWIAMETHLNLQFLEFYLSSIEEFRRLVLHDIPHEVIDEEVSRRLIG
ncbi:hypothetical protein CRE_15055 [Caenorhabditis remanei]|uniref:Sdz-33 F-box domain-containing protein n=1 Tax=Caenorhabditis remanei TaxID=31234 RepID=E3NLM1_CAERE|nr:hypothetical protein CRE_15055 [Caenorhabditis remanei]